MIISSFRSEYGVSVRSDEFKTMKWAEFAILLGGLGEDSPLARTAAVRLETDPKVIERFNTAQRRMNTQWRAKRAKAVSEAERDSYVYQFQQMFKSMCEGGG